MKRDVAISARFIRGHRVLFGILCFALFFDLLGICVSVDEVGNVARTFESLSEDEEYSIFIVDNISVDQFVDIDTKLREVGDFSFFCLSASVDEAPGKDESVSDDILSIPLSSVSLATDETIQRLISDENALIGRLPLMKNEMVATHIPPYSENLVVAFDKSPDFKKVSWCLPNIGPMKAVGLFDLYWDAIPGGTVFISKEAFSDLTAYCDSYFLILRYMENTEMELKAKFLSVIEENAVLEARRFVSLKDDDNLRYEQISRSKNLELFRNVLPLALGIAFFLYYLINEMIKENEIMFYLGSASRLNVKEAILVNSFANVIVLFLYVLFYCFFLLDRLYELGISIAILIAFELLLGTVCLVFHHFKLSRNRQ